MAICCLTGPFLLFLLLACCCFLFLLLFFVLVVVVVVLVLVLVVVVVVVSSSSSFSSSSCCRCCWLVVLVGVSNAQTSENLMFTLIYDICLFIRFSRLGERLPKRLCYPLGFQSGTEA